jgi:hypothetical protein
MKRIILMVLTCVCFISASDYGDQQSSFEFTRIPVETIEVKPKPIKLIINEDQFINAIIQVESRGNDSAIGDRHIKGGEAIGALQIRPIMVKEVNRILKLKKSKIRFKMSDRWDRDKSIEMFRIWKEFHHDDDDFETIARNWNGGPNGYKKSRTERYWAKVEQELGIYN